ncbi:MAG: acetate--CoA ligase family protein [Burkholderiaceae bacterium]
MSRASLDRLFAPRSIAFIGASDRAQAPASRGLRHCQRLGFDGALYPVNPRYATLYGLPSYAAIGAVPEPVDLAVIALSAQATLGAVAECVAAGVGAIVVCSAGWAEAGEAGQRRSEALQRLLDGSGTRLLGPNCIGLGNAAARMCVAYNSSFEHLRFAHRWPVGLACQSGAMLGGLLLNAEDAGFGIEAFAHVGNGLDIPLEEAAAHLLRQDGIQSLALMVEGVSSGGAFVELAREVRAAGKRIAVFKAGRSEAGRQAVQSHTGALAGVDELFDAVCREHGVLRVDEPEDLLPTAAMLGRWRASRGRRVLVFTLSGGAASVLADELASQRLELPALAASTMAACNELAPELLRASNPLDAGSTVFSDLELPARALELALADDAIDAACWVGVGAPRDERSIRLLGDAVERLAAAAKPAVIVPLSGNAYEAGFEPARTAGIPVARSLRSAAGLLAAALSGAPVVARSGPNGRSLTAPPGASSVAAPGASPAAAPAASPAPRTPRRVLPENEARALLRQHGLPVPVVHVARRVEEVAALAAELGFPVVVKGLVEGIAHKTEAGLVALNLDSAEQATAAARAMRARHAQADFIGFSVERMIGGGVETVVGIRNDPQFGPMLAFGLGGIAVELFRDVAFRRCPLDRAAALELIGQTRASQLLAGFRGRPKADVAALADAMVALSRFAELRRDEIAEVEINPLIVLDDGRGAVAVDALVVTQVPSEQ